MLAEADQLDRLVREAHAALDRVREVEQAGGLVEDGDVDDLCVEDVADPVADGVVDRLQLELAGERFLDAVDQRELCVALARLLDRPRSREGGADMLADEREQLLVLLGVANVRQVRLHGEDADRAAVVGLERDAQPVLAENAEAARSRRARSSFSIRSYDRCCGFPVRST